jgi:hypothetical protein
LTKCQHCLDFEKNKKGPLILICECPKKNVGPLGNYDLDFMIKTFLDHSIAFAVQNKDEFNLPLALYTICKQIKDLKDEHTKGSEGS